MGTLIGWSTRYPRTVMLAFVVVCVVAALGVSRLRDEEDLMVFLPTNDPDVQLFEDVSRRFGSLRVALIGVEAPAGDDVFSAASLTKIGKATNAIRNVQGVDMMLSLTAVSDIVPGPLGAQVVDLVAGPPKDEAEHAALRAHVMSREFAVGNLVSRDGRAALIMAFLADPKKAEKAQEKASVDKDPRKKAPRVEDQIRAAALAELPGMQVYFGGAPFAARAIYEEAQGDVRHLSPAALFVLLMVVILAFRDPLGVALTVGSVVFGVLVVLGGMGWWGEKFTVATSTLPVILFASGSSYAVHVLGRYYLLRAHKSSIDAIREALTIVGPPLAIAAATTSVGFFSFMATDVRPMRGFGIAVGMGVLLCWLTSLTLVPAAMVLWPRKHQSELKLGRLGDALVATWHWAQRRWLPLFLGALALGAVCVPPMLKVKVRMEPRAFFRVGSEPWLADHFMEEHFGGATFAQVWLQGDFDDPATLREVARLSDFVRAQPAVTDVQSVLMPLYLASAGMNGRAVLPWKRAQSGNLHLLIGGQAGIRQLVTPERRDILMQVRMRGDVTQSVAAMETFVDYDLRHHPAPPTVDDVLQRLGWQAQLRGRTIDAAGKTSLRAQITDWQRPLVDEAERTRRRGVVAEYLKSEEAPPLSDAAKADVLRLAVGPDGAPDLGRLGDVFTQAGATAEDAQTLLGRLDEDRRVHGVERALPALLAAAGVPASGGSNEDEFARAHVAALADDLFVTIAPSEKAEGPLAGRVAGEPVLDRGFSRAVGDNQLYSLGVTIVAVILLMFALFRRVTTALLSMFSSLLTMAIIFGAMGLYDIPIDLGTSLVAGIATGAGSDFAMHYLWYLRRQSADEVSRTVGPIMVVSILLVSLGFWVLALGKSPVMHLFGTLAGLSMFLSAALTCLLVPAVLSKVRT